MERIENVAHSLRFLRTPMFPLLVIVLFGVFVLFPVVFILLLLMFIFEYLILLVDDPLLDSLLAFYIGYYFLSKLRQRR